MEELIIDYINSGLTLEGDFKVMFFGKSMYFEDVQTHLVKVFNVTECIIDSYLIDCIFNNNLDFNYNHWRYLEKPPEPKFDINADFGRYIGGMDMAHGDAIDVMSIIPIRILENVNIEIVRT